MSDRAEMPKSFDADISREPVEPEIDVSSITDEQLDELLEKGEASVQEIADENAGMAAFPTAELATASEFGLTKREILAMAAMHGILGHPDCDIDRIPQVAKTAVAHADTLLSELAKTKGINQ